MLPDDSSPFVSENTSDAPDQPKRSAAWLRRRDRLLILAGLLVSPLMLSIYSWQTPPPGRPNGLLAACPPSPNCVCSLSDSVSPNFIFALKFKGSWPEAKQRLKDVLRSMPRMKIVEEDENYLRVEATTLVMRFVDDVEFQFLSPLHGIQMRSASRIGYSDFDRNRKRMEEIRRLFDAAEVKPVSSKASQ